MLGCQDFCGHYEWTFHYIRRRWGNEALRRYWAEAIGGESQRHYIESALQSGLRGLYERWTKTGEEEVCDWTFTLDEAKNVLRCDMRKCPSKGFLMENDLNADEDYCDHCLGWMLPLLDRVGVEVVQHEHNHCGQCWTVMRAKDRPMQPLELDIDIRKDPRWNHGFLHRWEHGRRQPLLPSISDSDDVCDVLTAWFAAQDDVTVLGCEPGAQESPAEALLRSPVLTTDATYVDRKRCPILPSAVLIGYDVAHLPGVAARFRETAPDHRPLLLHPYLPALPPVDFVSHALPRPLPILPLLIRRALYAHQPGSPTPDLVDLLILLAVALQKRVAIVDVDLDRRPVLGKLLAEEALVKHSK